MMERDVEHDHNEPNGAMAALLAPLLAVVCLGGAIALLEPAGGVRSAARAATVPAPAPALEIDAERYEGLRDLLPGDAALARRTLEAMHADGRIDEKEFDALVGYQSARRRTSLDLATARGDLLRTAHSYADAGA